MIDRGFTVYFPLLWAKLLLPFLRNYSNRVRGRLTNNTAEIQAATCAIKLAKKAGNIMAFLSASLYIQLCFVICCSFRIHVG
jgi:hypothetical protein